MQNMKDQLAERLRDIIAMTPKQVYLAGSRDNLHKISGAECLPWPTRINIKLEGHILISMCEGGQVVQRELHYGDINFVNAFAPIKLHEATGSGLSLVLRHNYLRIVYAKLNGQEVPDLEYYHIYDTLRMTTVYAFKSLEALCNAAVIPSQNIAGRLIHLIMEMSEEDLRHSSSETFTRSQNLWLQLVDYIEDKCLGELSREKLADVFKVTPEYVSNLFQRYSNCTFKDYIIRRRMEHAAQMLLSGKYSVDETAWQCGFKHTAYFIKTFRLYHGMTPGSFRTSAFVTRHGNRNIIPTVQTTRMNAKQHGYLS